MKTGHLYRADFDNLENRTEAAYTEKKLASFVPETYPGIGLSAFGKASNFIAGLQPYRHYLGHDNQIYPKLIYKEEESL